MDIYEAKENSECNSIGQSHKLTTESIGIDNFMDKLKTIDGEKEKQKLVDLLQVQLKHTIDEFCQANFKPNEIQNTSAPSTPSTSDWCIVTKSNPNSAVSNTSHEGAEYENVSEKGSSNAMVMKNKETASSNITVAPKGSKFETANELMELTLPEDAAPNNKEVKEEEIEPGAEVNKVTTNIRKASQRRETKRDYSIRCNLCNLVVKIEKSYTHLRTHKKYVCKYCQRFATNDKQKFKNHVKYCME